jgi:hypothetical protein
MTTSSTPNPDPDQYRPGVCECCGAEAPVIPLLWQRSPGLPIGRCTTCHNAPEEREDNPYSDGSDDPSAWWPYGEPDESRHWE